MENEESPAPVKQGDVIAEKYQLAAMGCMDASVFGDTGDGC